jgi:sugar phosphate isomerase/epimerase
MKIGMVSDNLAHLERPEMLKTARAIGIEGIEFNTGNWSSAPHLPLAQLLQSAAAREEFAAEVRAAGLEIIALNCNGTSSTRSTGRVRTTSSATRSGSPGSSGLTRSA